MVKAKQIILSSIFDGEPKTSDFELKFEELPDLSDGGKIFIQIGKKKNCVVITRICVCCYFFRCFGRSGLLEY